MDLESDERLRLERQSHNMVYPGPVESIIRTDLDYPDDTLTAELDDKDQLQQQPQQPQRRGMQSHPHPHAHPPEPAIFQPSIHSHFLSILDEDSDFPHRVFRNVDTNHDGMITMTEFDQALEDLHYEEIKEMHKTIQKVVKEQSDALEKKLELILNIEDELLDLTETCQKKEDVYYNNIGMTTASDIDALFARSKLGRNAIETSIGQLKCLVEEAKINFSRQWDTDI
jgi:hypothetical protein